MKWLHVRETSFRLVVAAFLLLILVGCPIIPPLTPPTGLTVDNPSSSSLSIHWDAAFGAASYELFRGSVQVYAGLDTSYEDTGLASSTTYHYSVQATYSNGFHARSLTVPGTTMAVLSPPDGLRITGTTSTTLDVSWNPSSGATTYQLYRDGGEIYSGSDTSYADTGLAPGAYYFYRVRARSSVGISSLSSAAAGLTLPASPTGLSVASPTEVHALSVSWSGTTGVTGYRLYRDGVEIYTGWNTSCTDTGLEAGTTYSYQVCAYNASGNGDLSASVSGTTWEDGDLWVYNNSTYDVWYVYIVPAGSISWGTNWLIYTTLPPNSSRHWANTSAGYWDLYALNSDMSVVWGPFYNQWFPPGDTYEWYLY